MIIRKWKQADCAVAGNDHKAENIPCQDKTAMLRRNGVTVIALGDGAGSRKNSGLGAEEAVNSVCGFLAENFEVICGGAHINEERTARLIVDEISGSFKNCKVPQNSLASTLLFAAIKNGRYVIGHIGDGVIGGLFENGLGILSGPENAGAPNLTYFLTDADAHTHLRLKAGKLDGLKGIILMSDGLGEIFYRGGRLHQNTQKLFTNFKGITEERYRMILGDFLIFKAGGYSDDDLSLNILYLEETDVKAAEQPYIEYLFSDIKSIVQAEKISANCCFLNNSFAPGNNGDSVQIRNKVCRGEI